jgi:hypothetical protein
MQKRERAEKSREEGRECHAPAGACSPRARRGTTRRTNASLHAGLSATRFLAARVPEFRLFSAAPAPAVLVKERSTRPDRAASSRLAPRRPPCARPPALGRSMNALASAAELITQVKTCRRFPISIACVPPLNAYVMDQRHACSDEAPLAPGEQAAGHVLEDDVKAWLPFCQALPKAELHAHINGSVREATIMCVSLAAAIPAACRTR